MLHVTNGDSAAGLLRDASLGGEVLPWRDVLHEGPVPDLPLHRLSPVRARFLADRSWAEYEEAMRSFAERDATLERATDEDEVVLWFEHDLYDQLQLVQILDHLSLHPARRLSLVCIGAFPGVERFIGLGQLTSGQLASLFPAREPVTGEQLRVATEAWAAFRAPEPVALAALPGRDTAALPFLRPAILRLMEHFPSVGNGLNRTERQILSLVAAGVREPRLLFAAQSELEEAPFLGDSAFFDYLAGLLAGDEPLLRREDADTLVLTGRGAQVREGRADRIAIAGIDRWIGGSHLRSPDAVWRWDPEAGRLQGP